MGKYCGVSPKFVCAPPNFVAYEKPSFVICRAESEPMRPKMKISVSEEIFTACCLPAAPVERAWGLFSWALSNKWEVGVHLHSQCFLFVANFVVIWLIVWSAAFPIPLCFWLKIPVLCDTERRHLWPKGLSEATFSGSSHSHSRDHRSQLGWGWHLFPLLLFLQQHKQQGVLVGTHVDSVPTGACRWWDPSATKLSAPEVPFTIKRLALENR